LKLLVDEKFYLLVTTPKSPRYRQPKRTDCEGRRTHRCRTFRKFAEGGCLAITAAAKSKANIPNLKEILIELSETVTECRQVLDYYDETEPLPDTVRLALARAQDAIGLCASALVLHYSTTMPR
jgi:hypothetical protein